MLRTASGDGASPGGCRRCASAVGGVGGGWWLSPCGMLVLRSRGGGQGEAFVVVALLVVGGAGIGVMLA